MPNNTATVLKLTGDSDQIKRFIATIVSKESNFDFNTLVPQPKALNNTTAGFGMKITPEQAQRDRELVANYGACNWYDWNMANWGTKWNAYSVGKWKKNNTIYFETAWTPATKFFLTASLQFPAVKFTYKVADEGGGFLGWDSIQNGKLIASAIIDWGSEKGQSLRKYLRRRSKIAN